MLLSYKSTQQSDTFVSRADVQVVLTRINFTIISRAYLFREQRRQEEGEYKNVDVYIAL